MDCEVTREALYESNEAASQLYEASLQSSLGKRALDYLHQRAFTDKTLQHFRIGYAPAGMHVAFKALHQEQGIPTQTLLAAGILKKHEESGHLSDVFHDRITFPLQDYRGIVGFTARTLGNPPKSEDPDALRMPKYINTHTTNIYQKSKFWYNEEPALKAARESEKLFLVEGPTSVMRASQHNLEYFVCSCGTSITEEQIASLRKRFPQGDLILCTDGDDAGQRAAEKILSHSLQYGLKVCTLPTGKDPDELMQKAQSSVSFLRWAEYNIFEGTDFLIDRFSKGDILTTVENRKRVLAAFKPAILNVPLEQRAFYTEAIAQRMGISSESLKDFFGSFQNAHSSSGTSTYAPSNGRKGWERNFWRTFFNAGAPPEVFRMYQGILENGIFSLPESKALLAYAQDNGGKISVDGVDTPLLGGYSLTRLMSEVKKKAATQQLSLDDAILASLIAREPQDETLPRPLRSTASIAEIERILAHLLIYETEDILRERYASNRDSLTTLSKIVNQLKLGNTPT